MEFTNAHHFTSFTIRQPMLGAPLQFTPALGSPELSALLDAFITGSNTKSKADKLSEVTLDFFNNATVDLNTGALVKTYYVYAPETTQSHSPSLYNNDFSPLDLTSEESLSFDYPLPTYYSPTSSFLFEDFDHTTTDFMTFEDSQTSSASASASGYSPTEMFTTASSFSSPGSSFSNSFSTSNSTTTPPAAVVRKVGTSGARVTKKSRSSKTDAGLTKKAAEICLPGFSIMTKDGVDVTNSAGRGTKTKEQREHAHLMRIMKACGECKRKKIKCDPSHRRDYPATPSRVSISTPSCCESSSTSSSSSDGSSGSRNKRVVVTGANCKNIEGYSPDESSWNYYEDFDKGFWRIPSLPTSIDDSNSDHLIPLQSDLLLLQSPYASLLEIEMNGNLQRSSSNDDSKTNNHAPVPSERPEQLLQVPHASSLRTDSLSDDGLLQFSEVTKVISTTPSALDQHSTDLLLTNGLLQQPNRSKLSRLQGPSSVVSTTVPSDGFASLPSIPTPFLSPTSSSPLLHTASPTTSPSDLGQSSDLGFEQPLGLGLGYILSTLAAGGLLACGGSIGGDISGLNTGAGLISSVVAAAKSWTDLPLVAGLRSLLFNVGRGILSVSSS